LTVNAGKCELNKDKLTFFGIVFSKDGILPDPKKIEAISTVERPTHLQELRSYIGMMTCSSRFIPGYATIVEPLRRFNKQWNWTDEQESAFQLLRHKLTEAPAMAYFDPNKPIDILVDASPVGLGAMLTQDGRVVAFASRALSDVESRYSQTEREALAVVWGCEHFNMYVNGAKHFTVTTDHKPLEEGETATEDRTMGYATPTLQAYNPVQTTVNKSSRLYVKTPATY